MGYKSVSLSFAVAIVRCAARGLTRCIVSMKRLVRTILDGDGLGWSFRAKNFQMTQEGTEDSNVDEDFQERRGPAGQERRRNF